MAGLCYVSMKSQQVMLCVAVVLLMVVFYWTGNGFRKTYKVSIRQQLPVPKLVNNISLRIDTSPKVVQSNNPIIMDNKYGILRNESQVKFEVCKTFKFSPVDWTLYELKPYEAKLESVKCRALYKEIFQEIELPYMKSKRRHKRVKWIVRPNGAITNLGCTKHTEMCAPGSFFDKKRNIRIDTPPCCRKKMMNLVDFVSEELNKNNIKYLVAGGLVLGYARSKEIIHYDEDIDMFIEKKYWRSIKFKKIFNGLSRKYGFYQEWRTFDYGALSLWYSKKNRNRMGMWYYDRDKWNPVMIRVPNSATPQYHYRILEPPRLVSMNGIRIKMPNNILSYLNKTYGKGKWQHELLCKKKDERKCI